MTSLLTSPSFTSTETFTIKETRKNQDGFSTAVTVTVGGTGADDFVAAVNAKVNASASATSTTELINVRASKLTTGEIVLTHVLGGDIRLVDTELVHHWQMQVLIMPQQHTFTEHLQRAVQH